MIKTSKLKAKVSIVAITTILSICSANVNAAGQFIGLGTGIGAFDYDTVGISANGVLVTGEMLTHYEFGSPYYENAIWTQASGMVRVLDLTGGVFQGLSAINADGSAIVGSSLIGTPFIQAARWTQAEGIVRLGFISESNSYRYSSGSGISADGSVIVGRADSDSVTQAYRWTQAGGMVGLGDLDGGSFRSLAYGVSADGSVVVGYGTTNNGQEAFRWTQAGGMTGLGYLSGGYSTSIAREISADGSVIIGYSSSSTDSQAFRWTQADAMVGLGYLAESDTYSRALGTSGNGSVIVGTSYSSFLDEKAFIWTEADGMVSLMDWLIGKGINISGFTKLMSAEGISADGKTIVGYGINSAGQNEAFYVQITAVPEPESLAMLIAGLGLVGFIHRRNKQLS